MRKDNKAFLVAIEGTDGAGKETQTALVVATLRHHGYKVGTMSFPRYDTPTGMAIKEMLVDGTAGVYERADMYAADRAAHKDELLALMRANDFVVLDRYIGSMVAYSSALVDIGHNGNVNPNNTDAPITSCAIVDYIQNLELDVQGMPVANLNLSLIVEPTVTAGLMKDRASIDANERSIKLQEAVYQFYRNIENREKSDGFMLRYADQFAQLECTDENGKMVNRTTLSNEIVERIMCFYEGAKCF
jgi:dTMP kinase